MKIFPFLYKKLTSILTALVGLGVFLSFGSLAHAAFDDVSPLDQKAIAINTLVDQGIIKGLDPNTFGSSQTLNRAQAVALMLRYGGYQVSELGVDETSFPDVDSSAWYAAAVEEAVELGIIKGHANGTFAPAEPVRSAQFLIMVTRTDEIDLSLFEGEQWYSGVMKYAQDSGVYLGENPAAVLSRGEAANLLYLSLLLRQAADNDFLSAQSQQHLSRIEASVAANQLSTAQYHADLALQLTSQVQRNLPEKGNALANKHLAQAYSNWLEAIVAALGDDNALALAKINAVLQEATDAYFARSSTQSLGSHLKDLACEIYGQLPEPKGEMPEDCVGRLGN